MTDLVDATRYPHFAKIVAEILRQWPEHRRYLATNLAEREEALLQHSERLSKIVWRLGSDMPGGFESLISDYRFIGEKIVLPEELFFRRHGRYRLTSFEEALKTVYNDAPFMTRYMNGLLVTDIMWINHCRCMLNYANEYLPSLGPNAELLEVGPGHGLLLYLADAAANVVKSSAWDVSQASLDLAAHTMKTLGAKRPVTFEKRNIFEPEIMRQENANLFDGVVLSEVLEHLEQPLQALKVLHHLTKPGGRVWINVPANSPAPDHLYLVKDPKQAEDVVKEAGFEIAATASYPMSGVTLERAIRQKLTVSCVVVGRKPGLTMAETPALIFDHIGIVAADVTKACRQFGAAVGATGITERFEDAVLGVTVQFIRDGSGIVYEMIAALGEASPVAKALASKTNLLNQVAYRTASIAQSAATLRKSGNFPLGPAKPALAFDGAQVQFLFSPLGFVVELIEAPGFKHAFRDFAV